MLHGYRLFRIRFTGFYKTGPDLSFGGAQFGAEKAVGKVAKAASAVKSAGGARDVSTGRYLRIDCVNASGWVVVLSLSGGLYGDSGDVVSTVTHRRTARIGIDDAVMRDMRVIMFLPDHGDSGVLLSEVRGNSHLTTQCVQRINEFLRDSKLSMKLEKNLADAMAWDAYLNSTDVSVRAVELVQSEPSKDRTTFGATNKIASATLRLVFADNPAAKRNVFKKMRKAVTSGKKASLAGAIGMKTFKDDDFDEQRIVYVKDGREKKVAVTQEWPVFVHPLPNPEMPPSLTDLMSACRQDVTDLLTGLKVDLKEDWWPELKEIEAWETKEIEARAAALEESGQAVEGLPATLADISDGDPVKSAEMPTSEVAASVASALAPLDEAQRNQMIERLASDLSNTVHTEKMPEPLALMAGTEEGGQESDLVVSDTLVHTEQSKDATPDSEGDGDDARL